MIEMSHTVIDPRTVMVYQERSISKRYAQYRNIPILSTHLYDALRHGAPCIN